MALLTVGLGAWGARSPGPYVWGTFAGLSAWIGVLVSFSLLPVIPLAFGAAALAATDGRGWGGGLERRLARQLGGAVIALLAAEGAARVLVGYDTVGRWQRAMAWHAAWKAWDPALGAVLEAAVLNVAEFGWWMGPGLMIPAIFAIVQRNRAGWMARGLAVMGVVLALTSQTKGETARLWLFLVPGFALVAADTVRDTRARLAVLGATLGWAVVLKAGQDFF